MLRLAFNKIGVDVFPHRKDYHYVSRMFGDRAQKHIDIRSIPLFGDLASSAIAEGRTMLYYDRLYTIFQSLQQAVRVAAATPLRAAEVGVFQGGTSRFIARALEALGANAPLLRVMDTFEGHASADLAGGRDAEHHAGLFSTTSFESVRDYLDGLPVALHKGRIQDTAHTIASEQFHFVHLDVDIYEPMRFALDFFADRLAPSCAIVVDDYGFWTCPGAKAAVDEFVSARSDFFSLHLLTGQCVLSKGSN